MKRFLRWQVFALALILLVALVQPVLAEGGDGGKVVFGNDFTLRRGERLESDLVVFGGSVTLEPDSRVRGDVAAFGGMVRVDGRVDGDIVALGGDVLLGEGAIVSGNVTTSGNVETAPGAIVRGKTLTGVSRRFSLPIFRPLERHSLLRNYWSWNSDLGSWYSSTLRTLFDIVVTVALGVLVVLLIPRPTRRVSDAIEGYPLQSIGFGLLTGLAAVLVLPILIITCIGIPVALLLGLALAVAVFFGWVAAGLILGERLLGAFRAEHQPVVAVAVGLALLGLLETAPCLGFLVSLLAGAWGLGAVVLTVFGSKPYTSSAPAVAPVAGPEPGVEPEDTIEPEPEEPFGALPPLEPLPKPGESGEEQAEQK